MALSLALTLTLSLFQVVLPLSETSKLAAKPKLLEDLAAMEAESRGWFSA